jgi:tetratricopeptide (TPR) repeat protein
LASFFRGLCLVLTVSMAATRPSSAIRAGSPDSSLWWETKDFADLIKTAQVLRAAQDFAGLETVYAQGYGRAKALGNLSAQISYLNNLGTARMLSLRYAQALEAYLKARTLAEEAGNRSALGGIAVNLAMIYQHVGDADAALSALERGKAAVDRMNHIEARTPPAYKAQLLMRLRSVQAALQENPDMEESNLEPRY